MVLRRVCFIAALAPLLGCEDQFQLRLKSEADITLDAAEHVERVRPPPAARVDGPHFFDDVGVRVSSGAVVEYWREGEFISSTHGSRVLVDPNGPTLIHFAVHPGRRDVDLVLGVPTTSICELRRRRRPKRSLALFLGAGGALAAAGAAVGILETPHASTAARGAEVGLLIAGAAVLLAGATMFFWPAGEGTVDVDGTC